MDRLGVEIEGVFKGRFVAHVLEELRFAGAGGACNAGDGVTSLFGKRGGLGEMAADEEICGTDGIEILIDDEKGVAAIADAA